MANFTSSEKTGIALMTGGIIFGLYNSVISFYKIASTLQGFSNFLDGEVELEQIKNAMRDVSGGIGQGVSQSINSNIGFWVFLFGVMVFLISRRAKWNSDLATPKE